MPFRFALCLALSCWLPVVAVAQQVATVRVKTVPGPYLRFDQFMVNNEAFKQGYEKSMQLQDSRGYLWFLSDPNSTQQLIRYDGTYYRSFGSLGWYSFGTNGVGVVKENEFHEIWATNKNGLALFDPNTETFRSFRNPYVHLQTITSWVMSPSGKHWFTSNDPSQTKGTIWPFYEFDSRTRQFRKIRSAKLINGYTKQPEVPRPTSFYPKIVDNLGRVWGSISSAKVNYPGYYDPITNFLVWYPVARLPAASFDKSAAPNLSLVELATMLSDGQYIWIGCMSRMGLLRFDTQRSQWKQFYFNEPALNQVHQIIPRNPSQFWLKAHNTLALFDKITQTLYVYPHLPDNSFTPTGDVYHFIIPENKSLWMGAGATSNRSTLHVLHESKQYFTFSSWISTVHVLYKHERKLYYSYQTKNRFIFAEYNEATGTATTLYQLPLTGRRETVFTCALRDSINQTVWLTGQSAVGGIFRFDEKNRTVEPVRGTIQGLSAGNDQLTAADEIREAAQDKAGNVWFPVYNGKHLLKYDHKTKQFVGFPINTHGLPGGNVRSAMTDALGQLWLGWRGGGTVCRFDPNTNQATVILANTHHDSNDASKLVDDPARGVVWIARSQGGLWKYDRKKKTAQQVVSEQIVGLGLHLTKSGNVWFKTLTALVRLNPETGQQIRFGADYDLHNFNSSPFIKTDDDEFFFEKFRFYDHDIKPDTTKPTVVLSFLKVFDRDLQLPKSLNYTNEITLNYDQNFFAIGFSALSYFQQERNQYAYRLVGFNRDWVSVGNKPLAVFSNVPPGDYVLQLKGSNHDGVWSEIKAMPIQITPPFWQTGWFRIFGVMLAIAVVVAVYRFQLERQMLKARLKAEEAKRKQTEAELNEREATYQLKLSQTEMAALRAQMNPHFIFNCLNSIQYFTAQNDADKASDYLAKFSRLIRLVLENSKSDKVTLANELETLRLYIEMEAMRFPDKLHYQIQLADGIDAESIQIPPLLLQPFVENAIWHGLMHKDEGGLVQVVVAQPTEDRLHIEITDDGVGRQKAAEYKSKSATKNKSFGMKLTAERIQLINQLYNTQTQISITDLTDAGGNATGTRVTIEIPV